MLLQFRPKPEKIVELLLYLAHTRPDADAYQAVKFLYLADREHLIRHGRPITFEQYVAMDYGPVASNALDLLEGDRGILRWAGIEALPFRTEIVPRPGKSSLTVLREPFRPVDFEVFSKSDLRVFDGVIEEYGNKTFNELYNITHNHFAYKRAWRERGNLRSSVMRYDEMIESDELRSKILLDVGPISSHL